VAIGFLKKRLAKTRETLKQTVVSVLTGRKRVSAGELEEIEEALICADLGVEASEKIISRLEECGGEGDELLARLRRTMLEIASIKPVETPAPPKPVVYLLVGVNGVGKTSVAGKMAYRYRKEGKKVLLVAGDTFRAAADEQLKIWAARSGCGYVGQGKAADPASVVYDGLEAAVARDVDTVIVDTAGRIHTNVNLMEELKKIKRVAGRKLPGSPHEIWLVLDATTGQNGLSQAAQFNQALGLTGIVLTKVDGTAKGGIVLAVCERFQVPIRMLGVGESMEDLIEFDAEEFVDALLAPAE